jgi:hypothetical protein
VQLDAAPSVRWLDRYRKVVELRRDDFTPWDLAMVLASLSRLGVGFWAGSPNPAPRPTPKLPPNKVVPPHLQRILAVLEWTKPGPAAGAGSSSNSCCLAKGGSSSSNHRCIHGGNEIGGANGYGNGDGSTGSSGGVAMPRFSD